MAAHAKLFCSVIIPTIGRDTLARAVSSALDQAPVAEQVEVIVVNDSGRPLPPAEWQQSPRVSIITTQRRERSVARNVGAALARGTFLCFVDDDDWLLPDALAHFQRLVAARPDAVWLYGGIQIIGADGKCVAEANSGLNGPCLAQIMGGAWVPLQSSLIPEAVFFKVGGFNPAIRGTEDQDLCRRIVALGSLANIDTAVACLYRGDFWQTSTDYGRAAEDTRLSRDEVVDQPGSFRQMMSSAETTYWYGRVCHIYVSLALWHWRQQRPFTAFSRTLYALAAFIPALPHLLTHDFWHAFRAEHPPGTLHFIQKQLETE